jgi:uncharacterized protein YoxC
MSASALAPLFQTPQAFHDAKQEANRLVHLMVEAALSDRLAARTLSGWNPAAPADEVVSELRNKMLAMERNMHMMHKEACSRIRQVELRGLHIFEYYVQPNARTTSKLERQVADLLKSAELMHKTINEQTEVINQQSDCINQLKSAMTEICNNTDHMDDRMRVMAAAVATMNNQFQQQAWAVEQENTEPSVIHGLYADEEVLEVLPNAMNFPR